MSATFGYEERRSASLQPVHSAKWSHTIGRRLKFSAAFATAGRNIGGSISADVMMDVHLMKSLLLTPRSARSSFKSSRGGGSSLSKRSWLILQYSISCL